MDKETAGDRDGAQTEYNRHLVFYLNGERVQIRDVDPRLLLIDYLRSPEVGRTGTKKACGQGGCGACTVMLASYDAEADRVDFRSINSCLHPVAALDGMAVTTTEGLGSVDTKVSPVQYRIAKCNGSQCGYCTPGWVMNMHSFLVANQGRELTQKEIEDVFDGNLCRCTGYRPILYAMKHFASDWGSKDEEGSMKTKIAPGDDVKVEEFVRGDFPPQLRVPPRAVHYAKDGYEWYRPIDLGELYALLGRYGADGREVKLVVGNTSIGIYDRYRWDPHILIDVSQVPELTGHEIGDDELVLGAATTYSQLIAILEKAERTLPEGRLAGVRAMKYLAGRTAGTIVRNAASIAGNTMLVVDHIRAGDPFPSDMFTAYCTMGAVLRVGAASWPEQHLYPILEFAEAYNSDGEEGRTLREEGVILDYHIPNTAPGEIARTYKVALRHENSHAIVNAGMRVRLGGDQRVENRSAVVVYGGIGPVAFHASRVEDYLDGRLWDEETLSGALAVLGLELREHVDATRERMAGVPWDGFTDAYRVAVAESFFYQFFVYAAQESGVQVPPEVRSAGERYVKGVTRGRQHYEHDRGDYAIREPYIKLTAFMQATGEIKYTHDLPLPARGLEGALVTSAKALARFRYRIPGTDGTVGIDELTEHLKEIPGVEGYVTYRDVPGTNDFGFSGNGKSYPDELFCSMTETDDGLEGQLTWFGQSIGLVLAENEQLAIDVAWYVQNRCIEYLDSDSEGHPYKPQLEIHGAPLFPDLPPYPVHIWKITRAGSDLDWTGLEGEQVVGGIHCEILGGEKHFSDGQIHFYMETQSCLAEPGEGREMRVRPSSQSPDSIQDSVREALAVPVNVVDVVINEVGGGYGGKTTRSPFIAAPAAVAARAMKRPVRLALARDVDTATIGRRHPLATHLKLAVGTGSDDPENRGKLVGLSAEYVFDGGGSYDCSFVVMDCMQLRSDSAYMIPNYQTSGEVAQTNKTSNTAYRAFGMIQSMVVTEDAIEHAAWKLGMPAVEIRAKNLYRMGDSTPYGEYLDYCYMGDVFAYARKVSHYDRRAQEVEAFNRANRWRKRGICLMPLKYGSGFNLTSLEQTGALIEVFERDGTVLVRQGAVEIGQGAITKIVQIAAYELNVDMSLIHMGPSDTSVVPNPSSTGASTGTAYGGGAVMKAARALRRRLEEYCLAQLRAHGPEWCRTQGINFWDYPKGWRQEIGEGNDKTSIWLNIVNMAFNDRVNLSAQARFRQTGGGAIDSGLTFHAGASETVQHFVGYTFNAACSEVEVDVLTGETFIRRCDVIYDMGKSINPAIDVGQVEGAFMQGVGYVLTEKLVFEPEGPEMGRLNTLNTWTYKPPATSTVPEELNVYLYPRSAAAGIPENPNDLLSAKEVGEPPLVLATTVFCAVKQAVMAVRKDLGRDREWVVMPAPATIEVVRQACAIRPEDTRI